MMVQLIVGVVTMALSLPMAIRIAHRVQEVL